MTLDVNLGTNQTSNWSCTGEITLEEAETALIGAGIGAGISDDVAQQYTSDLAGMDGNSDTISMADCEAMAAMDGNKGELSEDDFETYSNTYDVDMDHYDGDTWTGPAADSGGISEEDAVKVFMDEDGMNLNQWEATNLFSLLAGSDDGNTYVASTPSGPQTVRLPDDNISAADIAKLAALDGNSSELSDVDLKALIGDRNLDVNPTLFSAGW